MKSVEAQEKVCPFIFRSGYEATSASVTSVGAAFGGIVYTPFRCLTTGCMAWWSTTNKAGYCKLIDQEVFIKND